MMRNKVFYYLKPFIPRSMQLMVRRQIVLCKRKSYRHIWPIDPNSADPPNGWMGWPDNKRFALVLSHDVETKFGQDKCMDLVKIEMEMGFRSSFNFVPERYNSSTALRKYLTENGFEVAVHGLKHDGKLFWSRKIFNERVRLINFYLNEWNAVGFHSPAMHRNLDWIHSLDILYDQSTFDTDPFEPQPDGVSTIFPLWIRNGGFRKGYVELPYTLPQDHLLFVILREKNNKVWKDKLDWIADKGGMALLNSHPDYMNFTINENQTEEYPIKLYKEFLEYIKTHYKDQYWHPLAKDMARFWVDNMTKNNNNI